MMYLGIDKGKNKHHAFMIDQDEKVLLNMPFENTLEKVQELIVKVLGIAGDVSNVAVGIETNHGLLIDILLGENFKVFSINPKLIDHARNAMTAAGCKCDESDAVVVTRYLMQNFKKLRPLLPQSELLIQIRTLVDFRQTLVTDKVALENRLQSFLENYFPAAEKAFDLFSDSWVMDFLADHPTPEKAALPPKKMEKWFKIHHPNVGPKIRQKVDAALNAPSLCATKAVTEIESRKMLLTLSSLKKVVSQIREIEKEITRLFDQHEDAGIFKSLPGAGKTLAPWLLANFGENREQFPDPEGPMELSGVSPVTFQSGKSKSVKIRRACSKNFRQALRLFSDVSIKRRDCWARRYYDKRRQAGDKHETALRKLAKRWLNIIWKLWHDHTLYCEAVHVENVSKRALPKPLSSRVFAKA